MHAGDPPPSPLHGEGAWFGSDLATGPPFMMGRAGTPSELDAYRHPLELD